MCDLLKLIKKFSQETFLDKSVGASGAIMVIFIGN